MMQPPGAGIQAVVFDLDGTLVDTERVIFEATRYAIRQFMPDTFTDDYLWTLFGRPVIEVWPAIAPQYAAQLDEAFQQFYALHRAELVRPLPGVHDVLTALHARGVPMAILSNKRRMQGLEEMEAAQLQGYFDPAAVLFVEDLPRSKPEPDGMWLALERIGAAPLSSLMVGDGPMDIVCAQRAGVPVAAAVWAGWARRQRAALEALAPDHLLEDIRQLLPLLPPE